jgi:polysaccharide biosynthesis protein PslJ
MTPAINGLQQRVAAMNRPTYMLAIGAAIGLSAAGIGLLLAVAGPVIAVGAILGVLAGLYVLTSLSAALYGIVLIMALLPFGTFPFRIGFTPTLLDAAFGAFLVVYIVQFMTGRRRGIRLTPVHGLIALYMAWLILSFVLGLRWARPTSADLRQFAETLLSISMTFVLVDVLRDKTALRRVLLVFVIAAAAQAAAALVLYAMNDQTAERTLIRLSRIGYPPGGVIRYIEDNPADSEPAIGTWVDPNALGGFLAICASLLAPQLLARRPVLRPRWLLWGILGAVGLALVLTFSRASLLAFAVGLGFIGLFRGNRLFLLLLAAGAGLILVLPQTQDLVTRFIEAFTGADLATQMRIGEYGDALELIGRYPITGVGFTGSPSIDLYTDVASMYLIMANQIGLVGVAIFAVTMLSALAYGLGRWRAAMHDDSLWPLQLGAAAALITALVNAVADLYFFRTDFQASITLFWLVVALLLAVARTSRDAAQAK